MSLDFLKKQQLAFLGIFLGGLFGFTYHYFIGCETGTCVNTSKPINSLVYGMVMGYLFFSMFKKPFKNTLRNV